VTKRRSITKTGIII